MLTLFNTLPVLDRVFDDVMRDSFRGFASPQVFGNGLDVQATNEKLALELDLPGVKAQDVSVEIEGDVLRIRGERKGRHGETGKRAGVFSWAYQIPTGYDTESMQASLNDGVLSIEIPRHPKAMPRKVPILSSSGESKQLGSSNETKTA